MTRPFLLSLLFTTFLFCHPLTAINLIPNGDFEEGRDKPLGWGLPADSSWEKEDGSSFIRLVQNTPGKMLMLYRRITLPKEVQGRQLSLSWTTRHQAIKSGEQPWFNGRILLKAVDEYGKSIKSDLPIPSFSGSSPKWSTSSKEFTLPKGTIFMDIMPSIFRAESGSLDIQELSLTIGAKIPVEEKVVMNVLPSASEINYQGRWTNNFSSGWTATGISFRTDSKNVTVGLNTASKNICYQVVIDEQATEAIYVKRGQSAYVIAKDLNPGHHDIELWRRSEGYFGPCTFTGIKLDAGAKLVKKQKKQRRIMVIGDSISCGYGNETSNVKEGNTVENQNGYLAYGPIAARALKAEIMMVCWSGRGMYRNRDVKQDKVGTLPILFDQTIPTEKSSQWEHDAFTPDIVVINLGTNDLHSAKGAKPKLNQEMYFSAYQPFIAKLKKLYPKVNIIVSIGPMAFAPISNWLKTLSEGDPQVHSLIYSKPKGKEDLGGHWHPSLKKHQKMAKELETFIGSVMKW